MDWTPIYLSLKLAFLVVLILFCICVPLILLIENKRRSLVAFDILSFLPLILPPTVLGFYIISYLSPASSMGGFLDRTFGWTPAFTFEGIVFATVVYSFPFMFRPLLVGVSQMPQSARDFMKLYRLSVTERLLKVYFPHLKHHMLSGLLMTFAHAMGAFGIVLMVGGNMVETRTASVAIYDSMSLMDYDAANSYALTLIGISISIVIVSRIIFNRGRHD